MIATAYHPSVIATAVAARLAASTIGPAYHVPSAMAAVRATSTDTGAGANRGAKPCSPQVGRLLSSVVESRADVFNANRSARSARGVNLLDVKQADGGGAEGILVTEDQIDCGAADRRRQGCCVAQKDGGVCIGLLLYGRS